MNSEEVTSQVSWKLDETRTDLKFQTLAAKNSEIAEQIFPLLKIHLHLVNR